jgi:hypothetical protein
MNVSLLITLGLLARKKQESAASHYRGYTGPDRNVDRLRVFNRQFEWAQLGFLGFPGIAETAIGKTQQAGYDQHDCHDFDCIHLVSPNYHSRLKASLETVITGCVAGFQVTSCRIIPADAALHKLNTVPLDAPALNDAQNNHDDRDNQKNVNESSDGVRGNQAQDPEDD